MSAAGFSLDAVLHEVGVELVVGELTTTVMVEVRGTKIQVSCPEYVEMYELGSEVALVAEEDNRGPTGAVVCDRGEVPLAAQGLDFEWSTKVDMKTLQRRGCSGGASCFGEGSASELAKKTGFTYAQLVFPLNRKSEMDELLEAPKGKGAPACGATCRERRPCNPRKELESCPRCR